MFGKEMQNSFLDSFRFENPILELGSLIPLTHHDPRDLRLIWLVKKCKIHFRILSDLTIQSWISLKKFILSIACN